MLTFQVMGMVFIALFFGALVTNDQNAARQ